MVDPIDPKGIKPLRPVRPAQRGAEEQRRRAERDKVTEREDGRRRGGRDRPGRIDEHC